MSFNTFGHLFRFTSFGESHGAAIGCVVDGCPPRIPLKQEDIQRELDRRRPGQSRFTTQRQEPDAVKIMSGVFTDERTGMQVTTGTPIMLMIENVDQRSKDYSEIKDKYRPDRARRPCANGAAQDRSVALGLERDREESILLPGCEAGRIFRRLSRWCT